LASNSVTAAPPRTSPTAAAMPKYPAPTNGDAARAQLRQPPMPIQVFPAIQSLRIA